MFGRLIKIPSVTKQSVQTAIGKKGVTPSVLSCDMNVLGNLVSEGMIDLDAQVDGNLKCHTAIIRKNARVRGDIEAESIHIYGMVEGVIHGQTVNLYSSAKVVGIIMHEVLSIEDGAFVDGKFKRTDKEYVDAENAGVDTSANDLFSTAYDDEPASSENEVRILDRLRLVS